MCNKYIIFKYLTEAFIVLQFIVLIIAGCKQNNKDLAKHNLVFKKENAINLYDANFYNNKIIIPLEIKEYKSKEYSLVHGRSSVKKDKENLFIYTSDIPYPIFRFDMEGNYINKIGDVGIGPNEFKNVKDMIINEKNDVIEILSNNRIYRFFYDGTPDYNREIGISTTSFTLVNGSYWLYIGNINTYSEYRLFQTDQNFNIEKSYLSDKSKMFHFTEYNFKQNPYNTFRESLYYNMYSIQGDSLTMLHTIQFPGMEFPSNMHKIDPEKAAESLSVSHFAVIMCYLENKNFIYIFASENDINSKPILYHWIINKNNNQEKIIKIDLNKFNKWIESSYLTNPQLLTDDDFLYFLGYVTENDNDDFDNDYDLNPSIVIVNCNEL